MRGNRRLPGLVALAGALGALGGFVVPSSAQDPEDNVGTSADPTKKHAMVYVTKRGGGSGTVRGTPVGLVCVTNRCKTRTPVVAYAPQTLIAIHYPRSRFVGWAGMSPCRTNTRCTIAGGVVTNLTAVFERVR